MSEPKFSSLAAWITPERVKRALMDMVDIRSPTGHEGEMAEYLLTRLRGAGLEAELQPVHEGRANVVGHWRGSGAGSNLLFTGHMDTSYSGDEEHLQGEGFQPRAIERDGWVWGLGANNMKSGLAAIIVALEAIAESGLTFAGDISFGAVVGEIEKAPVEEFQGRDYAGYGVGSKHLVSHGVTGDCAILAEPTGLRICTANMGCIWLGITVQGSVNHSALANKPGTVNAIEVMHQLQADIAPWARDYEARNAFMGEHPNVTAACIRGGAPWRLSRVPHACTLYLDVRTVPGQFTEDIKRELRQVVQAFARRTGYPEPKLRLYVSDPAVVIDEELPVVGALGRAQHAVMGTRPPSYIRRPGADAVHLTNYGVPCVQFGPGGRLHPDAGGGAMHAFGEHVLIDDVVTASRIYLAAALEVCERPHA